MTPATFVMYTGFHCYIGRRAGNVIAAEGERDDRVRGEGHGVRGREVQAAAEVRRRLGRGAACVPGPVSKAQDTWFLINYAIAGISGWPYDLERYGNESDMWVDWVRVYGAAP